MAKGLSSPARYTRWAVAGAGLASATWALVFLPVPPLLPHGAGAWAFAWALRLRALVYCTPLVVGLSLMFWAERRLRRGSLDDRWTEAELRQALAVVAPGVWKWIGLTLLAAGVLTMLVRSTHGGGIFFYALLFAPQSAQRIRRMLAPPRTANATTLDWRELKPIRSEHWGQHRA